MANAVNGVVAHWAAITAEAAAIAMIPSRPRLRTPVRSNSNSPIPAYTITAPASMAVLMMLTSVFT